MNNEHENNSEARDGGPSLAIYHANVKGTGAALKMTLVPAHDYMEGCIMLAIANQKTVGNRLGPNPTLPTFDWENRAIVKLDFDDLTRILQVLRGETEGVNDEKGIYHRSSVGQTVIKFKHIVDPISGYTLELFRRRNGEDEDSRYYFLMTPNEALGICEAITGAMMYVAFGNPAVINI